MKDTMLLGAGITLISLATSSAVFILGHYFFYC